MYRQTFVNPPVIVDAIAQIGIESVLELIRDEPDLREWIGSGGVKATRMVEDFDTEIVSRSKNLVLTPGSLSRLFRDLYQDTPGMNPDFPENILDAQHYLLMRYFSFAADLDFGDEETARQLIERQVDWCVLSRRKREAMTTDPGFIASSVTDRVMFSQPDMVTRRHLECSLELIIAKEVRKDPSWLSKQDESAFRHIRDWIMAAVASGAEWISNVNDAGCPKKLAKCGSVAALLAEANKQMRKDLSARPITRNFGDKDFATNGGPFHVVRLTTSSSLDLESERMSHCIGNGAYDRFLGRDDHIFLSLRDEFGRPHATMQVIGQKIIKFQGKANSQPKPEYKQAVEDLLSPLGIEFAMPTPMMENPSDMLEMFVDAYRGVEARNSFRLFGFGERQPPNYQEYTFHITDGATPVGRVGEE